MFNKEANQNKEVRNGIKRLCQIFGFSYEDRYGNIEIDEFSMIMGADTDKRPVTRKELRDFEDRYYQLLTHLNLEEQPTAELSFLGEPIKTIKIVKKKAVKKS